MACMSPRVVYGAVRAHFRQKKSAIKSETETQPPIRMCSVSRSAIFCSNHPIERQRLRKS